MDRFNLEFKGYWRHVNASDIPSESGVYCVYTCTYDSAKNTVSLQRLIYIGESQDINDRINNHERLPEWKRLLNEGEQLCFSYVGISKPGRLQAEAALINHHKPKLNREFKHSFPYTTTYIETFGENALLDPSFTVYPS